MVKSKLLGDIVNVAHITLDSTQTRQLEQHYIAQYGDYNLMQMAAKAMFDKLWAMIDDDTTVLIFTGSGNNGRDGFVIGKLCQEKGIPTSVIEVLPVKMGISAYEAKKDYLSASGHILLLDDVLTEDGLEVLCISLGISKSANTSNSTNIIIIDAITGIGFPDKSKVNTQKESYQKMLKAVELINDLKSKACDFVKVVSIDIPSLLSAQYGTTPSKNAVVSDLTLTVFTLKPGLFLGEARNYVSNIIAVLNDLAGFKEEVTKLLAQDNTLLTLDYNAIRPLLPKRANIAHKGDVGKLFLIGGNYGMCGALLIASLATLYSGAGLICSYPLSEETSLFNIKAPELLTATSDDFYSRLSWANVCLIGPGLGKTDRVTKFTKYLRIALAEGENKKPFVIDADGLYILDEIGANNFKGGLVITPHIGEAAKLLATSIENVNDNMLSSAQNLAARYHAVCVLKGATTVICDEHNHIVIAPTGVSGMASGGMGDLLSGLITSMIGQGLPIFEAAVVAVLIHGSAGKLNAKKYGNIGTHATSLLDDIRLLVNGLVTV